MSYILIFDYDGVIVDSKSLFMEYFLKACESENIIGIKTEQDFLNIFDGNMYESLLKQGLSLNKIQHIISMVKDGLLRTHDKMNLFPGMKEVLEKLVEKHILIVITSNDSDVVRDFFRLKEIELFDDIYGLDYGSSKVEKIKMIKRKYIGRDYFYIGDTIGDIREGKQAGVSTVAVTWGWHSEYKLKSERPTYLIHSPNELLKIFS